jgi:starvation-inducible DNA-binding protein
LYLSGTNYILPPKAGVERDKWIVPENSRLWSSFIMAIETKKSIKVRGDDATTPAPLATPTDLTAKQVQAVVDAVNPIIADTVALYIKVKNFHWHLAGSHYRDYHILFDEHAEQLLASLDPLAERVRRIGGTTLRSIGHVQQMTCIEDDDEPFVPANEMLKRLLADNAQIAQQLRDGIELAQEQRDHPTSDLLIGLLDDAEKRIWFLHETTQGGDNAL